MTHRDIEDLDFVSGFKALTIDAELFTHEAHLRICYLYIMRYGIDAATEELCLDISRFDEAFGDGKKYDEVLTRRAISLMYMLIREHWPSNFSDLLDTSPDLLLDFKGMLEAFDKRKCQGRH